MKREVDREIIAQLQKQILAMQCQRKSSGQAIPNLGLGAMESSFPGNVFPTAAIHELISTSSESAACTSAFLSVILGKLMQHNGFCLWVSTVPRRSVFPQAMKAFGIEPERILFVDVGNAKDTLWVVEEALKCEALTAVVGELNEIDFKESQRLQLAVEQSQVTGFIHRFRPKIENAVACVTRWKISPLISQEPIGLPGVGFPRWNVHLLKVRNGKPGEWKVQWSPDGLKYIDQAGTSTTIERKAG